MALLIDKVNYNSDKNVLETMPGSVTQEESARRLFQLLGYYPKWYRSAAVKVALQWNSQSNSIDINQYKTVHLDDYMSICDEDINYVYTITDRNVEIPTNGSVVTVTALEGKLQDLRVNGNELITIDMLDDEMRIYIPDFNVAENGIFVFNNSDGARGNLGNEWRKVDNVSIQELNSRVFSFNVDQVQKECYIQFPDDAFRLFGNGLRIKYITSVGSQGSVATGVLNKIFQNGTVVYKDETQTVDTEVTLNSENFAVSNIALTGAGYDPETINEMYRNYKKIVGTFDTLVTLRDYTNAFYNLGRCSNDFVCDRTNDIQNSYKILTLSEQGYNTYKYKHDEDHSPFDLKVYALQFSPMCEDALSDNIDVSMLDYEYQTTFWMFDDYKTNEVSRSTEYQKLIDDVYTQKCIQHDFKSLDENKIALIKNKYTIDCKIIPTTTLSSIQMQEVKNNIKRAIYKNFSARKVDFGEDIVYSDLFKTIQNADPRIKYVVLNAPEYHTYVMYYSKDEDIKEDKTYKLEIHYVYDDYHSVTIDLNADSNPFEQIDVKQFLDYGDEYSYDVNDMALYVKKGEVKTFTVADITCQQGEYYKPEKLNKIEGTMPQHDLTYIVTYKLKEGD